MAQYFYDSGPYLHSLGHLHNMEDPFKEAKALSFSPQRRKQKTELEVAIKQLEDRAQESKKIEDYFFSLFQKDFDNRTPSPQEWNQRYLGILMGNKANQFEDEGGEVGNNKYSKLRIALNNRSFAGVISSYASGVTALSKKLNELLEQEIQDQGEQAFSRAGRGGHQLLRGRLATKRGLAAQKRIGTGLSPEATIFNSLVSIIEEEKLAYKERVLGAWEEEMNRKKSTLPEQASTRIQRFLFSQDKEFEVKVRDEIYNRLLGTSRSESSTPKRYKTNQLTLEDFGYKSSLNKEEDSKNRKKAEVERENFVNTVANLFIYNIKAYWESDNISYASGFVGETTMEAILGISLEGVAKVINKASDKVTREIGKKSFTHESPVDIVIEDPRKKGMDIAIQVKNSIQNPILSDLRVVGSDIGINIPKMFSTLLDDMANRDIMAGLDKNFIIYQITNSYYRVMSNQSGNFFQNMAAFLQVAVDYFLKGDTARKMAEVQGSQAYDIGNHFIVRPPMGMVGLSSFLTSAANILKGEGSKELSSQPVPISFSDSMIQDLSIGYVPEEYHHRKLFIADAAINNGQQGPYPPALLEMGRNVGQQLYSRIPSPNVFVSVRYLAQEIQSLF